MLICQHYSVTNIGYSKDAENNLALIGCMYILSVNVFKQEMEEKLPEITTSSQNITLPIFLQDQYGGLSCI